MQRAINYSTIASGTIARVESNYRCTRYALQFRLSVGHFVSFIWCSVLITFPVLPVPFPCLVGSLED